VGVDLCIGRILGAVTDGTRTQLHEEAHLGRAARTACGSESRSTTTTSSSLTVNPHHHGVLGRVIATFKEVEEQLLASSRVNVSDR
jgi:hypothetical protein